MMALKNLILRQKIIFFIPILLLSFFLRFYRSVDLFVFSGDEEHQLSIAQTITENFHIEWVGVSSADTGFYLGPFWEYFGALWLFISSGDPAIVAFVASSIGLLTTVMVYLTGRVFLGSTVGLIASFLYATLPLIVYYDRKFWNPALTSLTSLVLLLSLYKTKDSPKWWVLVAFIYGMVFHVHLSLVPLGLIILYWFWQKGYHLSKAICLICLSVFFIIISPLLGFEYFHKFSNLKTPLRVIEMIKESPSRVDPVGHAKQLFKSLGRVWYLFPCRSNSDEVLHSCSPDYTNKNVHQTGITTTSSSNVLWLSVFSLVLLFWFIVKRSTWKEENSKLLGLFILIIIVSYLFLPNVPLEYYLLGAIPLFLYLPAIVFQSLGGIKKVGFLLVLLTLSTLGTFTVLTASDDYGLAVKRQLIKRVNTYIGDKKYELQAEGLCHKYEGWRFLFKAYAKKPDRSFTDDSLGWLYRDEITRDKVSYKVLICETRVFCGVPKDYQTIISEGGFKAYIY